MQLSHFAAGRSRRKGEATIIPQIAALPYRKNLDAVDVSVSVLLITSRDTGRWVIPKGNLEAGLAPHEAAAQEAEEEAGVLGAVSPTPLGSYRYGKRRSGDDWVVVDVDVYSLAVETELSDWKERAQRERRWFSLADAAHAVEEPDLRELILAFDASTSGALR